MSRTLINGQDITAGAVPSGSIDSSEIADGAIVNADIHASAAIARSKLAAGTAFRLAVNAVTTGLLTDAAAITASRALISDANGVPTHSAVTATELGYVSGVTSAIQTQLNAKITAGAAAIVNADVHATAAIALSKLAAVTASRALVSDGSGFVSAATTTATEIGYVNGVTSAIQTQLNARPVLLAEYDPAAAATVDITSVLTGYEEYEIRGTLRPSADDSGLYFRTDADAGASFDTTAYAYDFHGGVAELAAESLTAQAQIAIVPAIATLGVGNASGEHAKFNIKLQLGSASLFPSVTWTVAWHETGGNPFGGYGGGSRAAAATINAVRLLFSTGNATGHVEVWGYGKI